MRGDAVLQHRQSAVEARKHTRGVHRLGHTIEIYLNKQPKFHIFTYDSPERFRKRAAHDPEHKGVDGLRPGKRTSGISIPSIACCQSCTFQPDEANHASNAAALSEAILSRKIEEDPAELSPCSQRPRMFQICLYCQIYDESSIEQAVGP